MRGAETARKSPGVRLERAVSEGGAGRKGLGVMPVRGCCVEGAESQAARVALQRPLELVLQSWGWRVGLRVDPGSSAEDSVGGFWVPTQ